LEIRAAVDINDIAGDPARPVGGKKSNDPGDINGLAATSAAQGSLSDQDGDGVVGEDAIAIETDINQLAAHNHTSVQAALSAASSSDRSVERNTNSPRFGTGSSI